MAAAAVAKVTVQEWLRREQRGASSVLSPSLVVLLKLANAGLRVSIAAIGATEVHEASAWLLLKLAHASPDEVHTTVHHCSVVECPRPHSRWYCCCGECGRE